MAHAHAAQLTGSKRRTAAQAALVYGDAHLGNMLPVQLTSLFPLIGGCMVEVASPHDCRERVLFPLVAAVKWTDAAASYAQAPHAGVRGCGAGVPVLAFHRVLGGLLWEPPAPPTICAGYSLAAAAELILKIELKESS